MDDIENGIRGPNDEYVSQGEIFKIGSLFPILSKKVSKSIPITMGHRAPGMTSQILSLVSQESMHLILHMTDFECELIVICSLL